MNYEVFIRGCLYNYCTPKRVVIFQNDGDFALLCEETVVKRIDIVGATINNSSISVIKYSDKRFFNIYIHIYGVDDNLRLKILKDGSAALCYFCQETGELFCYIEEEMLEKCKEVFPGWF